MLYLNSRITYMIDKKLAFIYFILTSIQQIISKMIELKLRVIRDLKLFFSRER